MAEDSAERLQQNAEAPRKASNDAGTVEQHDLQDQIEMDRYLAAKMAVSKRKSRGLRFNKLVPPGAG